MLRFFLVVHLFYLPHQSEQKRFLQQHKLRSESYSKAAATIKKQRKKKTNVTKVGSAMDKEMKVSLIYLFKSVLQHLFAYILLNSGTTWEA